MIKLGLIGCGNWGRYYIDVIEKSQSGSISYVARPSGLGIDRSDHLIQIRDWQRMRHLPIDAFIVATHPDSHAEICDEILGWGRPVMVEKPMTTSTSESAMLMRTAKLAQVPFLVNHQHLFAPAYETLRDIFFGSCFSTCNIFGQAGNLGPFRSNYSALWDYGCHDMSMCAGLGLGLFDGISNSVSADGDQGYEYDLRIEFNRAQANFRIWNGHPEKARIFEVFGNGVHLMYDDLDPVSKLHMNGNPIPVSPELPLTRSVNAFCEAVRTGRTDWRFGPEIADFGIQILSAASK